jgi:hypothetical protein
MKKRFGPIKELKSFQFWKYGTDPLLKRRKRHLPCGLLIQPLTFRAKPASKVAPAIDINMHVRKRERHSFKISGAFG